jgi:outer membrane protein TolC
MNQTVARGASKRVCLSVALALTCAASDVWAQSLTWSAAVERAVDRTPSVLAAQARVEEVRENESVARMIPNPTLTIASRVESTRLYAAINVVLPIFGQLGLAADAAQARTDEARAQLRVTQLEAGLAALSAWIDLWSARASQRAADGNLQRLTQLHDAVVALTAAELRPRMDLLSVRAELLNARAECLAAAQLVLAAQATLAGRLGTPELRPETEGAPPDQAPESLAAVFAESAEHPAVAALRARATAAARDARTEERLRIPTPTLQVAGYFLQPGQPANDLYVGLGFDVPIFNLRGPLIARARARQATALREADAATAQLRADAAVAWAQFCAARQRAQAQLEEILPVVTEAADLSLAAYRAGRLDLAGLLAAEQRRQDAQLRADLTVADRARALVALQRAMGVAHTQ